MPAPIVYFELAGPDAGALRRFYASVFDWRSAPDGSIDAASTGGIRGGFRQDPAEKADRLNSAGELKGRRPSNARPIEDGARVGAGKPTPRLHSARHCGATCASRCRTAGPIRDTSLSAT
jgi:hypothetical protein